MKPIHVYNEIEPNAAEWLGNLAAAGEIPQGKIDVRPIQEINPEDLVGVTQFHTFAGIGGWPLPCASPAGPKTAKSGPGAARVNPSRPRVKAAGSKTRATSGPSSSGSLKSAILQQSLASKLAQRLESVGSMECSQTWKEKATPAGRSLWAHTASARRISDRESTGWPTCRAIDGTKGQRTMEGVERERERKGGQPPDELPSVVMLAGWTTAAARDWKDTPGMATTAVNPDGSVRNRLDQLPRQAGLAGWPTTAAQNGEKGGMPPETRKGHHIGLQDMVRGVILDSFLVPTGRRVVLAPEFSLWLMGFPEAWVTAAPGAKDWREAQAALVLECSKDQGTP